MTEPVRIRSGQELFDAVVGGGLPEHAITMIIGLPGTGKTMLAEQYVFTNATAERPALYFTTASEPLEKLVRYGEALDFFDASAVGSSVFYDDLGPILQRLGLPAVLDRIATLLLERRPGLVVIDSFKALQTYAPDALAFRRFVTDLAGRLSAMPIDTFWVGEYDIDEVADAPEFAVADAIVALETRRSGNREARLLQILKLRGSGYASGMHAYRLSSGGLRVFPRLADEGGDAPYALDGERLATGIDGLDAMLEGGVVRGSTTMVAGPSGSGKTLTGLQYLLAGRRAGERGIYATLQENPSQIERVARGFGWNLDGIDVLYRSPVDVYIDEWVYDLLDVVDTIDAKRIVIDSLTDLRFAAPDDSRFQEYVYSLVQRCSRRGITLWMTLETRDIFGPAVLTDTAISHLADNVVILRYQLQPESVDRSMLVLKSRATSHQQGIRTFTIEPDGIALSPG